MAKYTMWTDGVIAKVADVLGHTTTGLTGPEIGFLLQSLSIPDPGPITKRYRLRDGLIQRQRQDGGSDRIITFITQAMAPVRYTDKPDRFCQLRDDLNEVLVYVGLHVNDQGKVQKGPVAGTLDEAAEHANSLRAELRRRGTHPEVLRYCTTEILKKDAFHAMLEAAKSVADRLRNMSGLGGDGSLLVDATLTPASGPKVAINHATSETDRSEQVGYASVVRGIFGMYRNPTAHDPRLHRDVTDDELLEMLTTVSMIHRRLDAATVS